jgi:hypothetical protein
MPVTNINIPVNITDEFIENLICTMLEGGSNYWIRYVKVKDKLNGEPAATWVARQINNNLSVEITTDDDEVKRLNKDKIIRGILRWISEYPEHVSFETAYGHLEIDGGNIDAGEADIILQFALFGEIVYG